MYVMEEISVPHSQKSHMEVTHNWHAGNNITSFLLQLHQGRGSG